MSSRKSLIGVLLALSLTSCIPQAYPAEFGVSRAADGELDVWYLDCYNAPQYIFLEDLPSEAVLWDVEQSEPGGGHWPLRTRLGQVPPTYRTVTAVSRPLDPSGEYALHFGGGEVYAVDVRFRPSQLPEDGAILNGDGAVVSAEEFETQPCGNKQVSHYAVGLLIPIGLVVLVVGIALLAWRRRRRPNALPLPPPPTVD